MGRASNIEQCLCCGCAETSDCCCDFIYDIDTRYYNQQQHDLKIELVTSSCAGISSLTGVMKPEPTIPVDSDFCGVTWVTSSPGGSSDFIDFGGSCATPPGGSKVSFSLYCRSGEVNSDLDAATEHIEFCNHSYKWRLRVRFNNSACTGVPNENTPIYTESSPYGDVYIPYVSGDGSYEPECNGIAGFDNTTNCPPNQGDFSVHFKIDAPYPRDGLPAGQCDCCSFEDYYIIKISLDQLEAPTPQKPSGTKNHPYCDGDDDSGGGGSGGGDGGGSGGGDGGGSGPGETDTP